MLNKNIWLRKIIIFTLGGIALIVLSVFLFYYSVSLGFFGPLYSKQELKAFENEMASQVFTSDGQLIGKFFDKNRTNVKYKDIPPFMINALVATEDARYFEHEGIDFRSLLRVLVKSILLGDKSAGGGSTITQQLLKNMYGRKNFGPITMLVNKNKEIILAQRLESVYNKEDILTLYLNTVPFGENIYGVGSASQRFFGVPTSELKIEQAAVLIGMLRANTFYNPRLHADNAIDRRNVVFQQMQKYNYLSQDSVNKLVALPLILDYGDLNKDGIANYYLVHVRSEAHDIIKKINENSTEHWNIEKDGLIINTTLDYKLQSYALESFREHLSIMQSRLVQQYQSEKYKNKLQTIAEKELKRIGQLERKDEVRKQFLFDWDGYYSDSISVIDSVKHAMTLLHSGLIALDPQTGGVKVWVGGIDFNSQNYDQVLAKRQLASTFKPILYAAAMEIGKKPCDYISNSTITLTDFNNWSPDNYDHSSGGEYSLAAALAYSKNIPSVRLFFDVGFDEVNYLWKKMGFESVLENKPSIALGTADASVYELARAYSSFANGGYSVATYTIQSIISPKGDTIYSKARAEEQEEILLPITALYMNQILQKAINKGTGKSIRNNYNVNLPLAGKTGTSQGFSDAWFVAYNPSIIIATRVGANSPSIHFYSGANGSGGRLALPLVANLLAKAQNDSTILTNINTSFPDILAKYSNALKCDDYIEETAMDKVLGAFKSKNTTLEKEKKKAKRKKKKGLFKRKKK